MPATSRSSEPSTRSTGSCFTSSFSCIGSKFGPHLHDRAMFWSWLGRHYVAGFSGLHVGFDVEKIRGALGDPLEDWRGRLGAIIAGARIRLVDRNRDAQLRVVGR